MSVNPTGGPFLPIPEDGLVEQKQGQAILIWTIGAFCIFGWDLLLCLPREYKLIWKRPMNFSSALYLANRYFGAVQFCFVVSLVAEAWSPSSCKRMFYFEPVGGLLSTIISQMILGGRVYAIYSQNRTIGASLIAILVTEVIVCGIAISTIFPPPNISGPSAIPQQPCGVLMGPFGWLVTFWTMPLIFDTVTFLLTAWKAYDLWKKKMTVKYHGIFNIIWRDGLLYFFAIFIMNTANVIIFLTTDRALRAVNLPATLILEVVLSCRLILNLRESHTHTRSGPSPLRTKWTESIKLRSVTSQTSPSGIEKRIEVHSSNKTVENQMDTPEINYSPGAKISPHQDTWNAV